MQWGGMVMTWQEASRIWSDAVIQDRGKMSAMTPEERVQNSELESLRISKARIVDQLANAVNPARRAMLKKH